MQPQNVNQAIQQLKRKLEEEQRQVTEKKAALEHNTADKERLMNEIRTHEQEIHAKEAEILKLKQEIVSQKQEINKKDREKPKLQQEVSALSHQQDEQRREITAMEQSYRAGPGNNSRGSNPRPLI